MQVDLLISGTIPALSDMDSVQKAMETLVEYKVSQLPLVRNRQYLGLITEEEISSFKETFLPLSQSPVRLLNTFVYNNVHMIEALKVMTQQKISVLPVLALDKTYKGVLLRSELMTNLANQMSLGTPGAIIVLSMSYRDLSVAQIAQIVESNHSQLLFYYITSIPGSTQVMATIKVNVTDVTAIRADFERYKYEITAIYNHHDLEDYMKDRYESLMNYLSI